MPIPKIFFQTSKFDLPPYLIDYFKQQNPSWQYKFFTDEDISKYIVANPISELPNALEVFNKLSGAHKADFFRYYFLYLEGGFFLDSDAVIYKPVDEIIQDYSFVTCVSILNTSTNKSVFNGFLGAEPKNGIILDALRSLYELNPEVLKVDYFFVCKQLYTIIETYRNTLGMFFENADEIFNSTCKLYSENLIRVRDGVNVVFKTFQEVKDDNDEKKPSLEYSAVVNDKQEIIAAHFFAKQVVQVPTSPSYSTSFVSKVGFPKGWKENLSEYKVGLTLDLPNSIPNLFCNGIRQNVLYLGELLLNCGFDTTFIVNRSFNQEILDAMFYDSRFKHIKYEQILKEDFDLVFSIGFEMDLWVIQTLKYMGCKVVSYNCGNNYIIDSETMLFSQHPGRKNQINYIKKDGYISYDQSWSIPQMTNTNQYYWQTLMRTECIEVPFVWSPKAISLAMKAENKTFEDFFYKSRGEVKKMAIFEPNISIMKWCAPSLLICENAYRDEALKPKIGSVFLNNLHNKEKDTGINTFNIDAFTIFVNNLDLCVDKKLSIEGRFNTLAFMSIYADIAVSHQWENNLNYLYFDLAWMGWPIVHNASLCQDIGYYYPEFNYEKGKEKLEEAILHHEKNLDAYLQHNRLCLSRFFPNNPALQKKYIANIRRLYEPTYVDPDEKENNFPTTNPHWCTTRAAQARKEKEEKQALEKQAKEKEQEKEQEQIKNVPVTPESDELFQKLVFASGKPIPMVMKSTTPPAATAASTKVTKEEEAEKNKVEEVSKSNQIQFKLKKR